LEIRVIERTAELEYRSDLGVSIAIDDFGTGQSSLAYLKRFHIDYLKIDQSFVHGINADQTDESIVRAIIALGKNLKLCLIAEGVESEEQRVFLEREECDEMQGFLYSRPKPARELTAEFVWMKTA
jgi:diguanylate cyclase